MNTQEAVKELAAMPKHQLYDTLSCLIDSGALNMRDFFELYEKQMIRIKQDSINKVYEAEGIVFSMLYPLLYDTKQLSDAGKQVVESGIKFVESLGFHRTEGVKEKLNGKGE